MGFLPPVADGPAPVRFLEPDEVVHKAGGDSLRVAQIELKGIFNRSVSQPLRGVIDQINPISVA